MIRLGTRGSALALVQARLVADAIRRAGPSVEVVVIETEGDRREPDTAWGEGAFVAAISRALLEGRVDVAVHSAKDVPTDEEPRLVTAAYLPRADPRDALVVREGDEARTLADLPRGARVGTDSPRRTGFLLAARPDLQVHPLHGNVDTRLRRLDSGETDALVLAVAGLERLERAGRVTERLEPDVLPPAPGQGAIAVQVRADDAETASLVAAVDDALTRRAVEAERAFLVAAGGGCRAPIGALASVDGDELVLLGGYARPDGADTVVARVTGPARDAPELARRLASELGVRLPSVGRGSGAASAAASARPRVLVTRAAEQQVELVEALEDAGVEAVAVPAIAIEPGGTEAGLDLAVAALDRFDWVVVTSTNGAAALLGAAARLGVDPSAPRWAAVGHATAAVLAKGGVTVAHQPARASGVALGDELPVAANEHVLLARGDLADGSLPNALRARGAKVTEVVAYRTAEAPAASRPKLAAALAEPLAAVLLASGSAVRGLLELARPDHVEAVLRLPAICIGRETAREARARGFHVLATAPNASAAALAATTAGLVKSSVRRPPQQELP